VLDDGVDGQGDEYDNEVDSRSFPVLLHLGDMVTHRPGMLDLFVGLSKLETIGGNVSMLSRENRAFCSGTEKSTGSRRIGHVFSRPSFSWRRISAHGAHLSDSCGREREGGKEYLHEILMFV
jgi:hypothetical protein